MARTCPEPGRPGVQVRPGRHRRMGRWRSDQAVSGRVPAVARCLSRAAGRRPARAAAERRLVAYRPRRCRRPAVSSRRVPVLARACVGSWSPIAIGKDASRSAPGLFPPRVCLSLPIAADALEFGMRRSRENEHMPQKAAPNGAFADETAQALRHLLAAIEGEPVPPNIRELADRLAQALASEERRARAANPD